MCKDFTGMNCPTFFKSICWRLSVAILALVSLSLGCNRATEYSAGDSPNNAARPKQAGEATDKNRMEPGSVELVPIDSAKLADWIKRQDGKLVLVDFWATWCPPCVEKFPQVVVLHRQFADQGLSVIAVCVNELSESESVQNFLSKQHADFTQMITSLKSSETFADFGLDSVPTYRLYRDGLLLEEFSGQFEFSEIIESIERTLAN